MALDRNKRSLRHCCSLDALGEGSSWDLRVRRAFVRCTGGVWKSEIWESGDLEIWEPGNLGTWKSGNLEIWEPGNLGIWDPKTTKMKILKFKK